MRCIYILQLLSVRLTVRNKPEPVEQGDVDTEQCGEVEAVPHHLGDRPGEHHGCVQRVLAGLLISILQTWRGAGCTAGTGSTMPHTLHSLLATWNNTVVGLLRTNPRAALMMSSTARDWIHLILMPR